MSDVPIAGATALALGRAAAATRWSTLPERTRDAAVDLLLDTIAVMAAGSERASHIALRESLLAGADGPATVIGRRRGASATDAAFVNGTLPTVYQLDEGYRLSRGHPGIHVVPVALAIGEQSGSSAEAMLSAMIAGYEVAARIGRSLGGTRPEIHPHGNWGAVGAAATAGWLLSDGDADAIARAVDIAAGVAGYPDRRATTLGADVHHLWASIGAHTGAVAGGAGAAGWTPVPGALEDYLLPRAGAHPDVHGLLDGVSDSGWEWFALDENYIKFWPACGHTHTAIGATLGLLAEHPFAAADVRSIVVETFRAAANLDDRAPQNELAARFSIPAVVSATILDGDFGLDALRPSQLASPAWEDLAQRVHVRHDPAMESGYPERGRPLRLSVELSDGRRLVAESALSEGDPELPRDRSRIHEKARTLFARAFGPAAASALVPAILRLPDAGDLSEVTRALRAAAPA